MIAHIEGTLLFLEATAAVIQTSGLGYQVLLSKRNLASLTEGTHQAFFIHTHVKEDAFELYGFSSRVEKQIFLLLISVSGVGPKLALTMLSALEPEQLISAILEKDLALLSSIPGIDKKTAERLHLELKDKAAKMDLSMPSSGENNTRKNLEQAIRSLGYSKAQSDKALLSLEHSDFILPFEALIKKTLNTLSKNPS